MWSGSCSAEPTAKSLLAGPAEDLTPWWELDSRLAEFQRARPRRTTSAVGSRCVDVGSRCVDGRWVLYSLMSGPALPEEPSKTFLAQMAKKRLTLQATTLRTRPRPFKKDLAERFAREVLPRIAKGEMLHVIDREFEGLGMAQSAHEHMESNAGSGKLVLHATSS